MSSALTAGEIIYDRTWKGIRASVEAMVRSTRRGMVKNGATSEEVMLECSRSLAVVAVDIARLNLVACCGKEPNADELRFFFTTAVDLYVRDRLSH